MRNISEKEILLLIDEAIEARVKAYTKYSNFKVGAVVVDDKGNHHSGVNVENASYGLSICGERNAIFSAVTQGMTKIRTLCVVGDTKDPISPCGACRQVIMEFSDDDTLIILANLHKKYKIFSVKDLLPYGFTL